MYSICSIELISMNEKGINSFLNLVKIKNIGFITSNWRNIVTDALGKIWKSWRDDLFHSSILAFV
jgi:hypothetical protein